MSYNEEPGIRNSIQRVVDLIDLQKQKIEESRLNQKALDEVRAKSEAILRRASLEDSVRDAIRKGVLTPEKEAEQVHVYNELGKSLGAEAITDFSHLDSTPTDIIADYQNIVGTFSAIYNAAFDEAIGEMAADELRRRHSPRSLGKWLRSVTIKQGQDQEGATGIPAAAVGDAPQEAGHAPSPSQDVSQPHPSAPDRPQTSTLRQQTLAQLLASGIREYRQKPSGSDLVSSLIEIGIRDPRILVPAVLRRDPVGICAGLGYLIDASEEEIRGADRDTFKRYYRRITKKLVDGMNRPRRERASDAEYRTAAQALYTDGKRIRKRSLGQKGKLAERQTSDNRGRRG